MAADIQVIEQTGSLRLVHCPTRPPEARYAVIEARDGQVLTLHRQARRAAPDTAAGMAALLAPEDWRGEDEARRAFAAHAREGDHLSRTIW